MIEIKGVIPAIVTPMNPDETVNEKELRAQIRRQIAAGENGGRLPLYTDSGCPGMERGPGSGGRGGRVMKEHYSGAE